MINFKKSSLALGLVLLSGISGLAFAEGGEEQFTQAKAMTLKMLDQRMADLSKTKECIEKAKDKSEMKACRADAKVERKEHHMEMKEMREKMKMERKELKEQKEQKN